MLWDSFIYFAIAATLLWATGAAAAWRHHRGRAIAATALGLAIFLSYIAMLWAALERPPLRTMGETRLWYSFFLPLAGFVVYLRWRYRWVLSFTTVMATVFVCVNLFKPEIHTKALMPALQSPWFAPHVIVYMMAYGILGAATLMAAYGLWRDSRRPAPRPMAGNDADGDGSAAPDMEGEVTMVRTGWAFLTFGMLFGALWAKEAWGHYWSWDPKETWAATTWLACLAYMHYALRPHADRRAARWLLIAAFVLLQMCWWGINYLPAAQGHSVHTYSS